MAGSVAAVLLIFTGTVSSICNKIIYGLKGEGRDGSTKYFRKPWANTAVMFLGMAACLPVSFINARVQKAKKEKGNTSSSEQPLLEGSDASEDEIENVHISFKEICLVAVPTSFDLIATVLMSIGLLYVTASVYQMLRGAEMLFAALFSVTFLKRSLHKKHYVGLLCCVVGIVLVGGSSLLGGSGGVKGDAKQALLGMFLIIIAQAVQAAQITVEDYILSNVDVAPLTVVGWEGIWGTLIMAIALIIVQFLPGEDGNGIHEDSLDTWHMICNSQPGWTVPVFLVLTGTTLMLFNVCGMQVTDNIGATARSVFESLRTLFVWLVDLGIFYLPIPKSLGEVGEKWDNSSYLQAAGFAILVAGTVIYSKADQEEEHRQKEEHENAGFPLPKGVRRLAHRMHSIAAWTHGTVNQHRWKSAIQKTMENARDQEAHAAT